MTQDILDLICAQTGIDRDQDTTRRRHTKVSLQQRRNVGAEKSHSIMLLHPSRAQGRSQTIHTPGKLPIRIAALTMDHRNLIGENQGATLYKTNGRKFGTIDLFAHRASPCEKY